MERIVSMLMPLFSAVLHFHLMLQHVMSPTRMAILAVKAKIENIDFFIYINAIRLYPLEIF